MKKKFSLKWQILIILTIFTFFLLGTIYVFQTFFLDTFYKVNKINAIKKTAYTISESLESDELENVLDNLSLSNEVCIRLASNVIDITGYNENNACALKNMNVNTINMIAEQVMETSEHEKLIENAQYISNERRDSLMVFAKMADYKGDRVLVLVSAMVIPLSTTTETLKSQYIFIVLIVVIATILLAFFISRLVLKPIKEIKNEVINLPSGEYNDNNIKPRNAEIKSLNETLKEANNQILQADKAKKELIANVSHDLRTPLTMIVGYGEMIRDFPEDDIQNNATVIIDEATRLTNLVNDILDISKLDNNKITLDIKELNVTELLNNVYKQYDKYCKAQNIKFELDIAEDINYPLDEKRINQVIYNFMNNAINYNDKEEKEIKLGIEKIDNGYRVYVYDNGQGIKEENLQLIWDRYYKVDKEHKRATLGTGIGLALSRSILQAMNLNYGVESKYGEYSKFYFDLKS